MDKLKLVKNFPNRAFAEQACAILEENRIFAVLKASDLGIIGISTSSLNQGVNLYVEERNEQAAYDLLNALYNGI